MVHLSLPLRRGPAGELVQATIDIPVNGSLEAAGSCITLFGRLIDERSMVGLSENIPSIVIDRAAQASSPDSGELGQWAPQVDEENVDLVWQEEDRHPSD